MDVFISICIPAYNRPHGLKRLLESIAQQVYTNYEIIITDDSTNMDSAAIATEFSNKLPITYIKNEKSLGSPANWNKAISRAKYDWIKLMHDDDWFEQNNALALFADVSKKADFVFCGNTNIYLDENRKVVERLSITDNEALQQNINLLFFRNVIGHPSNTMYKKTALTYDEQFKWVVDIDFYIHYLKNGNGFSYIDTCAINTGIDSSTVSNSSYKNPKVEIPEYLNILFKMGNHLLLSDQYVFAAAWTLVKKFKIKNIETFRNNGYNSEIANGMQQIINAQQKIPRLLLKQTPIGNYFMKKSFNKLYEKN